MARSSRSRGRSGSAANDDDAANAADAAEQQSRPAADNVPPSDAAADAAAAAPAAPSTPPVVIPTDGPVPDSDTLFPGGSAELLACVAAAGSNCAMHHVSQGSPVIFARLT